MTRIFLGLIDLGMFCGALPHTPQGTSRPLTPCRRDEHRFFKQTSAPLEVARTWGFFVEGVVSVCFYVFSALCWAGIFWLCLPVGSLSAEPLTPPALRPHASPASMRPHTWTARTVSPTPTTPPTKTASNASEDLQWAESAVLDIQGGGARPGAFAFSLQGGFPWQALQAQVGLAGRLSGILLYESALFARHQISAGLGLRYVDLPGFRLSGEVFLGAIVQTGSIAYNAPSGELRLRMSWRWGRFFPYLWVGSRHALLLQSRSIDSSQGPKQEINVSHRWSPMASLGVAYAWSPRWALRIGVDWGWVDMQSIPIPGAHLALIYGFGGAR